MSKKTQTVERPLRDPDHVSKRGVYYYWAPEWVRGTDSSNSRFGKIKAIKRKTCTCAHKVCKCTNNFAVDLHMVSKDGNHSYIQGSIQREFQQWHEDRQIDYILLGEDPETASDLVISETEDTQYV